MHTVHNLWQDDLATAFDDNDSLVRSYQIAQYEFIREKTAALKVIERKLELETSLRDHKQVRFPEQIKLYRIG